MAKLVSIVRSYPGERRFFVVSFAMNYIRVLDARTGMEYLISIETSQEAAKMLPYNDAEWEEWIRVTTTMKKVQS